MAPVVVQIVLASVCIIVVECHVDFFNHMGLPSYHSILQYPEKHNRWHHNMFDPTFPNRHSNMYDSDELGYGHGVNEGSMHHDYVPDGTIMSYDNYGPVNGPVNGLAEPENPNYQEFQDHNDNRDQHINGSDDPSQFANGNTPTQEVIDEEQKAGSTDLNKPNGSEANEQNYGENNNERDKKTNTGNEAGVNMDASIHPDKKKLQENVVIKNDLTSSLPDVKINKPNTNYAISNGELIPLSSISISQNVPVVSNAITVPVNTGGVQLNPGVQIIGTDSTTGLPIINVNGALYYYVNPANNQVTTPKPAQIILLPTNVPSPGPINTVPTNPNYIILNGNGQILKPLNNGVNANARVNIGEIISYIQQHPEVLRINTNTATTAPSSQAILLNPEKALVNSNPINVAVSTSSNASPVGYQPTQAAGSQTNIGVASDQAANAIISFILQHPEIFGSNVVSNSAPSSIPNGNIVQNSGQVATNNNPTSGLPNQVIDATSSSNAYRPVQNQANGVGTDDIQHIIAIIAQHPEIFGSNTVSNNVPNSIPNGNTGMNNPPNEQNSGQGGGSGAFSSNANQPIQNAGSGNQGNNQLTTNDVQGIIAFISQHPEIIAATAVVPNNSPNTLNENNVVSTTNTQPNPDQESRNSFTSNVEPSVAIGSSNNVKVPNDIQDDPTKGSNIITFLTQTPDKYGPKPTDASNAGTPIEDKNDMKKESVSQGNNIVDTNEPKGGIINAYIVQHPETATVSPSPSGELNGNGNIPSYLIIQNAGNQPTNQPPNVSGTGLPLKTNLFNNDGNNDKVILDIPMTVLGITDTKDLEDVKVNKKATGDQELLKSEGAMTATKDSEEFVTDSAVENIPYTVSSVTDTVLQETTTQEASLK